MKNWKYGLLLFTFMLLSVNIAFSNEAFNGQIEAVKMFFKIRATEAEAIIDAIGGYDLLLVEDGF